MGIQTEDRLRLRFNYHGLINAYNRFKKAIEKKDDLDIYVSSSELILWAMNIEEWLCKWDGTYQNDKIDNPLKPGVGELKSLKYVFNTLKHNMGFIQTHRKNTDLTIPFDSNFQDGKPDVYWKKKLTRDLTSEELKKLKCKNSFLNQKRNFERHLAEKSMLVTVTDAVNYIISRVHELQFSGIS